MVSERLARVPLASYRVPGVDIPLVRVLLRLWIRTRPGRFEELDFVVDSASSVTTITVALARDLGLVIPRKAIAVSIETVAGKVQQIRHPGRLQGRVLGLKGWEFDWPCHFLATPGRGPKAILGLAGVLDDLRITLDGTYALEAPYGWLILERRRQTP